MSLLPPCRRASGLIATLALLLTGCDLPLGAPVWSTEWALDLVVEDRSTPEFLPAGITTDGNGFSIEAIQRSDAVLLEDVCETCLCFSGPIPGIELTPFSFSLPSPGALSSAFLDSGTANVTLINNLGFDLLSDPSTGAFGLARIALVDTRTNLVVDSLLVTDPFPPGDSLKLSFDLSGIELQQNLVARFSATIPGTRCDSIPLTRESGIGTHLRVEDAHAAEVFVLVSDGQLGAPVRSVDLPDVLTNRIRAGDTRLLLNVSADNGVPLDVEYLVSVATLPEDLFTGRAALFAPVRVAPGSPDAPIVTERPLVIDAARLEGASTVHISVRARVLGSRRLRLVGSERLRVRARLFAELPSR